MKVALALLSLSLAAASAAAAPTAPLLDDAVLQAAIDRELEGVPRQGRLDVAVHLDGTATVSYGRPDGVVLSRTVTLPPRSDDAVEMLALLAGNLVRDQAGDVLADLSLPPATRRALRKVWFSAGIFPPLSTDLLYGEPVVAHLGMHLILGDSPGFEGMSFSVAIDIQHEIAHGLQLSALSNVSLHDQWGAQLTGAANVSLGRGRGAQLAGGVNVAESFVGAQLVGGVNLAGALRGAQIAGTLNVARSFTGVQLAPINVAGHAHGLQLGVINYSDDNDGVPIGVISIVRDGITELDAWSESTRTFHIMLRHGARRFYNLYGVGSSVPGESSVQMFGLGFGSRILRDPVDLDVALMSWSVDGPGVAADVALLNQARASVDVRFGHVAIFGGAALNVFVADSSEQGDELHPVIDSTWRDGTTVVRMWPSLFAGLRVR